MAYPAVPEIVYFGLVKNWDSVQQRITLLSTAIAKAYYKTLIFNGLIDNPSTHNAGVGGSSPPVATI